MSWKEVFLIVSLPLPATIPITRHDNSGALSLKTKNVWKRKASTTAEMAKIDRRVSQSFQCIMQLTEPLEAHQSTLNLSSQANTRSMV
jgi:hypothetical protein